MPNRIDRSTSENLGEDGLLLDYLRCPIAERGFRFLDTSSAARLTGLSRRTIQWWVECGNVAAVMIGRRYQIERESLFSHLARLAQGIE